MPTKSVVGSWTSCRRNSLVLEASILTVSDAWNAQFGICAANSEMQKVTFDRNTSDSCSCPNACPAAAQTLYLAASFPLDMTMVLLYRRCQPWYTSTSGHHALYNQPLL